MRSPASPGNRYPAWGTWIRPNTSTSDNAAKAFASLADVSARELEATAEALGHRRRDPLGDFSSVFRRGRVVA